MTERRITWSLAALTAALSLIAWDAKADPPPHSEAGQAPQPKPMLPEVTVRAQREALERRVEAFVSSSLRSPYEASLARWDRPVCPYVVGLSQEEDKLVRARLSEIAAAAGARVAPQPCQGNFVVIVAAEPGAVLKAWYARNFHIFGDAAGLQIDEFLKTPRDVRVWYNTNSECASRLSSPVYVHGRISNGHASSLMTCNSAETSHTVFNAVRAFSSVIVAVDSSRTKGINLNQLADYAAVVGLAEIRLDADIRDVPTILHLFSTSEGAKPTGLSDWDSAFLKGLYDTSQITKLQRSAIAQSMVHHLAP